MRLSALDRRRATLYAGGALVGGGLAIGLVMLFSRLGSDEPVSLPVRLVHTVDPKLVSTASEKVREVATRGIQARFAGRAV